MAEIDVSSYPKPLPTTSPLDMAQKLGAMEQQKLNIDITKMTKANAALGFMTRAMGSLGPNASINDYIGVAQNAVNQGLVPQEQLNAFVDRAAKAKSSQDFYKEFMTAAKDHQQQIEMHLGKDATLNDNKYIYGGKTDVMTGGFTPASRSAIQIPPATQGYNEQNQQVYEQPAGPPGVVPVPRARPALPAERPTTGPTGPTVDRTAETPTTFSNRSAPLTAGPSPLFDEGKEAYTKDQDLATQKLTAIKPALLALDKIPGLRSGPGTKIWNETIAALKANNIIPIDVKNDPTAIYQEVNKYLSQYLKGRGTRSDADLIAAEESSPNVGKQISPALLKLTQTAVAQDRIEAARHSQFKKDGQLRTDFQNYGSHRASFPPSMDERAFIVDKMTPEQKQDLAKNIAKMKPEEKQRFIRSLKAYEDSKVGGQ